MIFSFFSKKTIPFVFFSSLFFFGLDPVFADFNQLTPCKDSPAFQKRLKTSIKKIENRLSLYSSESQEAKALNHEIQNIENRFRRYSQSSLLCGKDGLPRIITSGQWDRANEFVLPGLLFLYIAGWIGWVGRKYLQYANSTENAFENEIIINVPMAFTIMNSGFTWPIDAWKEFITGNLLASDENITISPR